MKTFLRTLGERRVVLGRASLYIEPRDLWVGVYVAPTAVYVCVFTLVLRWSRIGGRRG